MKTNNNDNSKRFRSYSSFSGLNVMRPEITLDTGEGQAFIELHNAHVDQFGQIRNDPPANKINTGNLDLPIRHVRYYSPSNLCWFERLDNGLWFQSDNQVRSDIPIYPADAQVSSCIFNKRVQFFSKGQQSYNFDGSVFRPNSSQMLAETPPAFGVSIQRRLIVAGFEKNPTLVLFSRVDNENIFVDDEPNEEEIKVTAAAFVDIANQLDRADRITGLAGFEQDKLAIFTLQKILIYRVDPDYTRITIDDQININVGTISHNTIKRVGENLLFCTPHGVASLIRSRQNGLTIDSSMVSDEVKDLYLDLLESAKSADRINSVYDEKAGQYHTFFPINEQQTKRLTLTMPTQPEDQQMKWSTGDFLFAQCGDVNDGRLVVGTAGGLYEIRSNYRKGTIHPKFRIVTPILWVGEMHLQKLIKYLLIQFAGNLDAHVIIEDEKGNQITSIHLESNDNKDFMYPMINTNRDFQHRLQAKVQGVRITIEGSSKAKALLSGFAFGLEADKNG